MKIVYWTSTGNTGAMAELIKQGVVENGKDAELINICENPNVDLNGEKLVALGCPAMGDEQLDEAEFEPFLEANKDNFNNMKVALFGSYGWGSGEWMESFEEKMSSYGAVVVLDNLTVNYTPEGESAQQCIDFGKQLSQL